MPATLPRIDQDVLAGIRIGDERSLERLFRDAYPPLTQEAAEQLDDVAGAPRVVEAAFRRLWDERTRFETRQSLESFLHSAIHEAAVRERKRLATLHRLEAGAHVQLTHHAAPAPSADEAWSHFSAALHPAPVDAQAAARARAEHSRHDAAEHLASIAKPRVRAMPIAVGALLAASVVVPLWYLSQRSSETTITRALSSSNVRLVSTVTGQQAAVTLLDGSRAALGADTKLVIAPDFGTAVRAVKLEGAALFTVAPGQKHEFHVRAGNAAVTATGTTFGVHAYPADETLVVGVREGTVRVRAGGDTRDVEATQGLVVTRAGTMREASATELEEALGWTENRLVIANRPLRQAVRQMARWYALDLTVRDSSLLDRPVTVSADLQSSRDAIAALERSGGVAFGYEDRTMVLRDARAPATKGR